MVRIGDITSIREPGTTFQDVPFDGILGLGYAELSDQHGRPVFHNMVTQNKVDTPIFGFWLNRYGRPARHIEPLRWMPVIDPGYWELELRDVQVDGRSTMPTKSALTRRRAAIDTGTSLIVVPQRDAILLHSFIPGARRLLNEQSNLWSVPCHLSKLPQISLGFGNTLFSLPPSAWVIRDEKGFCYSGFTASSALVSNEIV
ncbi:aspartic peptidase domain-containing protein [Syncephalis fuscata]|nr:aspartic peptidase domain-containing protein [Syncephalis fuscata]